MAERGLRILVIGNLPPHVLGGAENQVARLVEAWLRAGAQVEVAGHRIPNGWQLLGALEVRTHHLNAWKIGGRLGRAAGYALSLAVLTMRRKRDFDVAYCRALGDGVLSLVILKALGLCTWPLVACPINARGAGDVAFLRTVPGRRFWVRLIDRHVQAINLINAHIAEDLQAIGILHPSLSHIPNGVVVDAVPARAGIAAERRLIWTGRFGAQKGLDLLLPALAMCRQDGARFRVDLYGDGELREVLMAQSESLGLASQVHFHGPVAVDAVRGLLLQADVFVLPSRYEGMSNSALEAMEAGLPVLCTRCGGIDAAVDLGAGWVCEPGSSEALGESLMRMFRMSDDEVMQRGRRARALVEQHFAIELVAAANLALLSKVVSGSRTQ